MLLFLLLPFLPVFSLAASQTGDLSYNCDAKKCTFTFTAPQTAVAFVDVNLLKGEIAGLNQNVTELKAFGNSVKEEEDKFNDDFCEEYSSVQSELTELFAGVAKLNETSFNLLAAETKKKNQATDLYNALSCMVAGIKSPAECGEIVPDTPTTPPPIDTTLDDSTTEQSTETSLLTSTTTDAPPVETTSDDSTTQETTETSLDSTSTTNTPTDESSTTETPVVSSTTPIGSSSTAKCDESSDPNCNNADCDPEDPSCSKDCDETSDPSCAPIDCKENPSDPRCQPNCEDEDSDPRCATDYCDTNPTDSWCPPKCDDEFSDPRCEDQ